MSTDNAIEQLKNHLSDSIVSETRFLDEVTLEVRKENLKKILIFFKESVQPQYEVLMDLTGVDYLTPTAKTQVIYWLHNPTNFSRLRIVVDVAREESLPTVTDLWGGANWYERELYDLFGVKFEGHPDLTRLLMPDDWQGHPLRRDYALTEQPVQFKHQVKPKVPSEIIAGTVKNKNFK